MIPNINNTPNKLHLINSQPEVCSVAWEVTDKCNFNCWYCPDSLHAGKYTWPDPEVYLKYFNFLCDQNPAGVYVDMLGGEPTLWPEMADFVNRLPESVDCEVTTNGSRTLRWWERVAPRLKRVTISHHLASASDAHLFDVVKLLQPITHLGVLVLFDPEYRDRIRDVQQKLYELDISFDTKPIFPSFNNIMMDYSEDDHVLLNERNVSKKKQPSDRKPGAVWINDEKHRPRDLIINGQNQFKGWSCRAGERRIHIDPIGNVWAGSCRAKLLGKVIDLPLSSQPVTCEKANCTCIDDVRAEKWIQL